MFKPSKVRQAVVPRWLLLIILTAFLMACVIGELYDPIYEEVYLGPTLTEQAYQDTQDAKWDTALAGMYTHEAMTREAEYRTASPTPAPPSIYQVWLPSVVPKDGTTVNGTLQFYDPDGDINRLVITVVKADNFAGADYDPSGYIIYGDRYNGTYELYIWCEGVQRVTLRYTLYDLAGNQSNSVDATFECH